MAFESLAATTVKAGRTILLVEASKQGVTVFKIYCISHQNKRSAVHRTTDN